MVMFIFVVFAIPEILFSFVLSIIDYSGKHITPLYYFFVNYHFFIDHPLYLLIAEAIEWLGVLGLLIVSVKNKKIVFIILLGIILLWLSINFCMGYIISTMNPIF